MGPFEWGLILAGLVLLTCLIVRTERIVAEGVVEAVQPTQGHLICPSVPFCHVQPRPGWRVCIAGGRAVTVYGPPPAVGEKIRVRESLLGPE